MIPKINDTISITLPVCFAIGEYPNLMNVFFAFINTVRQFYPTRFAFAVYFSQELALPVRLIIQRSVLVRYQVQITLSRMDQ